MDEVVAIMKDSKTSRLRKGIIKDPADKMAVLNFKLLIEKESDGSFYDFAKFLRFDFIYVNIRILNNSPHEKRQWRYCLRSKNKDC